MCMITAFIGALVPYVIVMGIFFSNYKSATAIIKSHLVFVALLCFFQIILLLATLCHWKVTYSWSHNLLFIVTVIMPCIVFASFIILCIVNIKSNLNLVNLSFCSFLAIGVWLSFRYAVVLFR